VEGVAALVGAGAVAPRCGVVGAVFVAGV